MNVARNYSTLSLIEADQGRTKKTDFEGLSPKSVSPPPRRYNRAPNVTFLPAPVLGPLKLTVFSRIQVIFNNIFGIGTKK